MKIKKDFTITKEVSICEKDCTFCSTDCDYMQGHRCYLDRKNGDYLEEVSGFLKRTDYCKENFKTGAGK